MDTCNQIYAIISPGSSNMYQDTTKHAKKQVVADFTCIVLHCLHPAGRTKEHQSVGRDEGITPYMPASEFPCGIIGTP